jgi:hypothetical protein
MQTQVIYNDLWSVGTLIANNLCSGEEAIAGIVFEHNVRVVTQNCPLTTGWPADLFGDPNESPTL